MIAFPEVGYTPANLTHLLADQGIRRQELADLIGVSIRTVHYWCKPIGEPGHRDMPAKVWTDLLDYIECHLDPPQPA